MQSPTVIEFTAVAAYTMSRAAPRQSRSGGCGEGRENTLPLMGIRRDRGWWPLEDGRNGDVERGRAGSGSESSRLTEDQRKMVGATVVFFVRGG